MTANGQQRHVRRARSAARYHATPPRSSMSVTRSATESKKAPRWLAVPDALARAPSSRSGSAASTTSRSPSAQAAAPMATAAATASTSPTSGEVVGGEPRAAEAVADGLHGPLDGRPEAAVEHRPHVTGWTRLVATRQRCVRPSTQRAGAVGDAATPLALRAADRARQHARRGIRHDEERTRPTRSATSPWSATAGSREDDAGRGAAAPGRRHQPHGPGRGRHDRHRHRARGAASAASRSRWPSPRSSGRATRST